MFILPRTRYNEKLNVNQDACAYTDCPTAANTTNQYIYEFVTLNDVSRSPAHPVFRSRGSTELTA